MGDVCVGGRGGLHLARHSITLRTRTREEMQGQVMGVKTSLVPYPSRKAASPICAMVRLNSTCTASLFSRIVSCSLDMSMRSRASLNRLCTAWWYLTQKPQNHTPHAQGHTRVRVQVQVR